VGVPAAPIRQHDLTYPVARARDAIAFANIYRDKRYRSLRTAARGSGGRLINRQTLQELVAATPSPARRQQLTEDLAHAQRVELNIAGYRETAVIVDGLPQPFILPPKVRPYVPDGAPIHISFEMDYNVISSQDDLRGAAYPFLKAANGRSWKLISRPASERASRYTRSADRLAMEKPTLRWTSGNQVQELYIDGLTTEQYLAQAQLELSLPKGGYVLSKRLSRIMRPHFAHGFFDKSEVSVAHMELDEREAKIWDGAALISRSMLEKMVLSPDLSPRKRARLQAELAHAHRVSFTLLTEQGQDKGHAMVVDDIDSDFVLPPDTKTDVKLNGEQVFVGLDFVHGRDNMQLDVQSLINLHPFFDEAALTDWLNADGERFLADVRDGRATEAMGRIDPHTTLAEVTEWPLREFVASGGNPLWFRHHARSLLNQRLGRLSEKTLGKMRLPIPGGRAYVMPESVARRGGLDIHVPRGGLRIDLKRGTAWVNDEDWLHLPDSPAMGQSGGIASILGGADHDDALWLFPFTDYDGEQKVLAWRSPNQVGEYVVLKPTPDSDIPSGPVSEETAVSQAAAPAAADSRRLPQRIDRTAQRYLDVVDMASGGGLGERESYDVALMEKVVERAQANEGVLGLYCNYLMVQQAIHGRMPDALPARLETVIDSSVKSGEDLSGVKTWILDAYEQMLHDKTPVPRILHERISVHADKRGEAWTRPVTPPDHWLDRQVAAIEGHITWYKAQRDEALAIAAPPQALLDVALAQPETIELGAGLNQAYGRTMKQLQRKRPLGLLPADHEQLRQTAEDYLARFRPEQQTAILRGAMASAYLNGTSDAAVWLPGKKTDDGRLPGVASKSMEALREIGVLDRLGMLDGEVTVYPDAAPNTPMLLPEDERL
jgi:hypothetical protein